MIVRGAVEILRGATTSLGLVLGPHGSGALFETSLHALLRIPEDKPRVLYRTLGPFGRRPCLIV